MPRRFLLLAALVLLSSLVLVQSSIAVTFVPGLVNTALSRKIGPLVSSHTWSSCSGESENGCLPACVPLGLIEGTVTVLAFIDLSGHVEQQTLRFKVTNAGQKPAGYYLLPILASKVSHLGYAQAHTERGKQAQVLDTQRVQVDQHGMPATFRSGEAESLHSDTWVRVTFAQPLSPGESTKFVLQMAFTHTQRPVPESIRQEDNQYVLFELESRFVWSAYPTTTQTTEIKLVSADVLSHTRRGASANLAQRKITYGPFENVAAGKHGKLRLHYQNNTPFITFTSLVKEVQISHHGNVAVEEHYKLWHSGARLTGGYSRLDDQKRSMQQMYAGGALTASGAGFRTLRALLPPLATDLYYRDDIGNVSTSSVRMQSRRGAEQPEAVVFEIQPRFPMFGGWKTNFYYGYNIPTSGVLGVSAVDSSVFVADVSFGTPFAGACVDEFELRVVLPEFATDIEWQAPFDVDSAGFDKLVTYLDTSGRPVMVLRTKNVVAQHQLTHVQVKYRLSGLAMLKKPLLVAAAVMLFFLLCMGWSRFELGLSQTRAGAAAAQVKSHQE